MRSLGYAELRMPFDPKHHQKGLLKRDLGCRSASSSLPRLVKASNVVRVEENPESILEEGGVLCSHHHVNRLLVKMQVGKRDLAEKKITRCGKPAAAEAL